MRTLLLLPVLLAGPALADGISREEVIDRCLTQSATEADFAADLTGFDAAPAARWAELAQSLALTEVAGRDDVTEALAQALSDEIEVQKERIVGATILQNEDHDTIVVMGDDTAGPISCDIFYTDADVVEEEGEILGVYPEASPSIPGAAYGRHEIEDGEVIVRMGEEEGLRGLYGLVIETPGHVGIRRN